MSRVVIRIRIVGLFLLLALLSGCSSAVDVGELRGMVGDEPVVLLSTSSCGYCRKLRADLHGWGVEYADFDVETEEDGMRAFALANGRGVPILLIGDKLLHGYSADRAHALLLAARLLPQS